MTAPVLPQKSFAQPTQSNINHFKSDKDDVPSHLHLQNHPIVQHPVYHPVQNNQVSRVALQQPENPQLKRGPSFSSNPSPVAGQGQNRDQLVAELQETVQVM